MTTPETKTVTRTCITCEHEPEWKFASPLAKGYTGRCNSPLVHNGPLRISREQQVAAYEGQPITCCPGWLPKVSTSQAS